MSLEFIRRTSQKQKKIVRKWKDVLQKTGANEKEIESFCSNIRPLVESAMTKKDTQQISDFLDSFIDTFEDINRGLEYAHEVTFVKSASKEQFAKKWESIFYLYGYLSISEGVYCETVQLISFLLLANCHDIYDPRRMKFAKKCGDLDQIDIYVKLQFLKEHGFRSIVEAFDRKLRNATAHQKFIVEDNGDIIDSMTHKKIADSKSMRQKIRKLIGVSAVTTYAIGSELFSSCIRVIGKEKLAIETSLSLIKNHTP